MTDGKVPLLTVEDLSLEFRTHTGTVRALERVHLHVMRGETVGIVGESGSGKSVLSYTIMGILDSAAQVTSGRIVFGGLDLLTADEDALQAQRGREMAMIFQNPRASLNPIRPVGRQIGDVLLRHAAITRGAVKGQVLTLLARIQIPDPERCYHAYPFELSGGMCQRILIAMALACAPALLIADEPTTGLDVITQAAIMDWLHEFAISNRMATLLITHDLGLAARYCSRIVVMHAGHVVEILPTKALLVSPRHPYTAKLVAATPRTDTTLAGLASIPGDFPDLSTELPPCRYSRRCERYVAACEAPLPQVAFADAHSVACWRPL